MKVSQYNTIRVENRTFYIGSDHQKRNDSEVHKLIKKRYKKTNKNRNYIIDSVINQISVKGFVPEKNCYTVIKVDIKNFFESVNTHELYRKLMRSNILDDLAMSKIKQVVFSPKIIGLPQGVSFSSSLSEIYLEDFDHNLKIEFEELLYYSRFVDDILLIFNGNHLAKKEEIIKKIGKLLSHVHLELNSDSEKMQACVISSNNNNKFCFDYLGYEFSNKKEDKELTISVSKKKIIKYESHMQKLFTRYHFSSKEDRDFYKLYYSLRNLLWTTITKDFSTKTNLIYGFDYNYRRINSFEAKEALNSKLKYYIHCSSNFNGKQKKQLYSLLFSKGKETKYNFNKISTKSLKIMMCNLEIVPIKTSSSNLRNIWTGQIFNAIYN